MEGLSAARGREEIKTSDASREGEVGKEREGRTTEVEGLESVFDERDG